MLAAKPCPEVKRMLAWLDALAARGFREVSAPAGCWQFENERYTVTVEFAGKVTVERRGGNHES